LGFYINEKDKLGILVFKDSITKEIIIWKDRDINKNALREKSWKK